MTDAGIKGAGSRPAQRWIVLSGVVGLAGALLVGAGEFALHFNPAGGYEDPEYRFWLTIDPGRLDLGYALTVFAAPLYLIGYWHLSRMLRPASKLLAGLFFAVGAYGFVIGAVWIGQRLFLGWIVHAIAAGDAAPDLLRNLAARNEVLVNFLRVAVAANSLIWIGLVASGRTRYPRWAVVFAPAVLLAAVFASYLWLRPVGVFLIPTAMNVVHTILFLVSIFISMNFRAAR